jgi:hypothetical protein
MDDRIPLTLVSSAMSRRLAFILLLGVLLALLDSARSESRLGRLDRWVRGRMAACLICKGMPSRLWLPLARTLTDGKNSAIGGMAPGGGTWMNYRWYRYGLSVRTDSKGVVTAVRFSSPP